LVLITLALLHNYEGVLAMPKNMQNLLQRHGYLNDSFHMVVLTDDSHERNYMTTANNNFKVMEWLVQCVTAGDILFFQLFWI
jgi:hypothetical protein